MADETLLLQLDIGGDSGDAVSAASDVASAFEGLQGQLDAVNGAGAQAAVGADAAATATTEAGAAADSAGSSFAGMGDVVSGLGGTLGGLNSQMGEATSIVSELGSSLQNAMGNAGEGMAGLGVGIAGIGAAAVAAFAGAGMMSGQWATQLMQLSAITGMSTEETDKWSLALQDVGANQQALVRIGMTLNPAIQSAADALHGVGTESKQAKALTDELGVSVVDETGHTRGLNDVLNDTITALGRVQDPAERAAIAAEIFGKKFAGNMLILAEHNEVLAKATEQADRMSGATKDAEANAIKFNTSLTDLKVTIESMAAKVLPAFNVALEGVNKALEAVSVTAGKMHDLDKITGIERIVTISKDATSATESFASSLGHAVGGLFGLGDSHKQTQKAVEDDRTAWEDFRASATYGVGEVSSAMSSAAMPETVKQWDESVKQLTGDFDEATKAMAGLFHEPTQEELDANAMLSQRKLELEDLKLKGNAATDADRARIDQLKNQEIPILEIGIQRMKDAANAGEDARLANLHLAISEADKAKKLDESSAAFIRQDNELGKFVRELGGYADQSSSDGWAIGSALGAGMRDGMASWEGAIQAEAQRLAQLGADALAAYLQTKSPSQVTFEIGANVGKGLQLGMESIHDDVHAAFRGLADFMPGPAQVLPRAVTPAPLALPATASAGSYVTINIHADRYVGNHQEFAEEIMSAYVRLQRAGRISF